jgi:hypothetical protein
MLLKGGKNRAFSCYVVDISVDSPVLGSEEPMSDALIAGGALLVSSIALVMSVIANLRSYSMHQRMLDLERRLGKEAVPAAS